VEVIQKVAAGMLPRESAKEILQVAFQLDPAEADKVLGGAGSSFKIDPSALKSLAEKKKTKKDHPEAQLIRDASRQIRSLGRGVLPSFAKKYTRSVMIQKGKANEATQIKAPINATIPSLAAYQSALRAAYGIAAIQAQDLQEKAFKKPSKKLSEFRLASTKLKRVTDAVNEFEWALKSLGEAQSPTDIDDAIYALGRISDKVNLIFGDYLSFPQKQAIAAKAEVFSETQKNDIVKAVDLQYQSSLGYAEDAQLEQDMDDASQKAINGPMTVAGPDVQASQIVNETLDEAAKKYSEETGIEIISHTFVAVDDDATTELCSELDGSTFDPLDPDFKKYTPPLHFNCRSFMQVNTSQTRDNPDITGAPKLTKKAQSQLVLSEFDLGGPGSGCHGDNCGRPSGSGSDNPEGTDAKGEAKSSSPKKPMTEVNEFGAIKMKTPKNIDEANQLLDDMKKHMDAASKHFKDNPNDGFAAMRFNHTYKQVEKALRWAKKVNEKKMEEAPAFELAEYKGKTVELDKPFRTPDGPKKFAVHVKNDNGNVVLVRFGDPDMDIKRDDPERRKNFRARHKCDVDPGPKWKAKYWSCKFWSDEKVEDLL
jgi:SPP1 gp7 family putative phage head morphogenesis protein